MACVGRLAHAPYAAHKEDADHDQQNYSESDITYHGFPRSDALRQSAIRSQKMAILGFGAAGGGLI